MRPQDAGKATGAYIEGTCESRLWGMTGRERTTRLIKRLGLVLREELEPATPGPSPILLVRADALLEERLANALMERPGVMLVTHGANGLAPLAACVESTQACAASLLLKKETLPEMRIREAGIDPLLAEDLAGTHDAALRRKAPPFAHRLTTSNAAELERVTFRSAYKGVTDIVTKFVWPWPAFHMTRFLSRIGATPNMVTVASLAFTLLFFPLVLNGYFVAGLACAWTMALLDTVDGKLARVTLKSSHWGGIFDHGIDLIAPPLWWLAWWIGLSGCDSAMICWSVCLVLGGHIAGKLLEQAFISTFGIKTHVWRKVDSDFRLITARRNSNLAILTLFTLLGQPAAGYLALAAWILFSLAVHSVRYVWALAARRNGKTISSWLAEPPGPQA